MLRLGMITGAALMFAATAALAAPPPSGAPGTQAGHQKTLSTKLAQSNGTIRPPPTADTGMAIKPKQTGPMPVITPREKNGPGVVAK